MNPRLRACRITNRRRGFTLIEASLAVTIVGTAILAMMQLFATCTQHNRAGASMTTALYLANNIQEAVADLPFNDPVGGKSNFGKETGETLATFDDIDDFNGYSSTPPIDSQRTPVPELSTYTQAIIVQAVDPNRLTLAASGTDAVRVTVRILYDGAEVYQTSWVRMRT